MSAPEGKICWIEIPVRTDAEKLQAFYAAAFPNWVWQPSSADDGNIKHWASEKDGLGGGLVPVPEGCTKEATTLGVGYTVYFFVNSVDEATERIEKLGGKTVLPKVKQGEMGFFSNLIDVEGNRFGIYEIVKKSET